MMPSRSLGRMTPFTVQSIHFYAASELVIDGRCLVRLTPIDTVKFGVDTETDTLGSSRLPILPAFVLAV